MKTNALVVALESSLAEGALASLGTVAVAQEGTEVDAALFREEASSPRMLSTR